jgi:hypothetical protein
MTKEQVINSIVETKLFLTLLSSKSKRDAYKQKNGITHKQLTEMMNKGIEKLVVNIRDKYLFAAFIEDRGLINDMVEYHNKFLKGEEDGNQHDQAG